MEKVLAELYLPEGIFKNVVVQKANSDTKKDLNIIYNSWRNMCDSLGNIGARKVNIPEGLSEGVYCSVTGAYRTNNLKIKNANTSFDCYLPTLKLRIQVKACSIVPDLTSFGPHSVWDKLIFIDFYVDGNWDGSFKIYDLSFLDIKNLILNIERNETFLEQQSQGRRPRLSLYRLIRKYRIEPYITGNINNL